MKKIAFICASLLLIASVPVLAPGFNDDSSLFGDLPAVYIAEKGNIGLTIEQVGHLTKLNDAFISENASLNLKLNSIREDIKNLMKAGKPDIEAVKLKVSELEKVRTDLAMNFLTAATGSSKVLTSDQMKKLVRLRQERIEKAKQANPKGKKNQMQK